MISNNVGWSYDVYDDPPFGFGSLHFVTSDEEEKSVIDKLHEVVEEVTGVDLCLRNVASISVENLSYLLTSKYFRFIALKTPSDVVKKYF